MNPITRRNYVLVKLLKHAVFGGSEVVEDHSQGLTFGTRNSVKDQEQKLLYGISL